MQQHNFWEEISKTGSIVLIVVQLYIKIYLFSTSSTSSAYTLDVHAEVKYKVEVT